MNNLMEKIAEVTKLDSLTVVSGMDNTFLGGQLTLDPKVQEYILLDGVYADSIKPMLDRLSELRSTLAERYGVGAHFQDSRDGTVFEIATQEWKSVRMEPVTINRTRRENEVKGSLSEKRAKELGYTLPTRAAKG